MKILIYDENYSRTDLVKEVLTKNLDFPVEVTTLTSESNIISNIQNIKPEIFITDIKIGGQSVCCMNLISTVKSFSPGTLVILFGEKCVFPCSDCEYSSDDVTKNHDFFIDIKNGLDELPQIVDSYPHQHLQN